MRFEATVARPNPKVLKGLSASHCRPKLSLMLRPRMCQHWAMFVRLLVGALSVVVCACATDVPEFAPRTSSSSSASDPSDSAGPDAGDASNSTSATGVSTAVGKTTVPFDSTAVNPGTEQVTPTTTDPGRTDAETTDPDRTDAETTDPDTSDPAPECDNQCQSGEARCSDGELERCEEDADGCLDWGAPTDCDPATCATPTSCAVCDNKCSVGDSNCTAGSLETCVADDLGCLVWSAAAPCDTGTCSSATECLVCANKCSAGSTNCQGGQLRSCKEDANGCRDWSDPIACETGSCASASACIVCDNKCANGSFICTNSQLNACAADDQGCYDYTPESTCEGNTPMCNATAGRCECQSDAAPTCTNSTTVSQCTNGAWADSPCTGNTPVCVNGAGCQACTEHSQCPNSACHLAGTKKGTCFATSTVVNVNSPATFLNAINATTANGESVIKMSAGTYSMEAAINALGETAIIGQTGVIIEDNMPQPSDGRVSFMSATYISNVQLEASDDHHVGIGVSTGVVSWLDDSQIIGEGTGVNVNGEIHIRRSRIFGGGSGALAYYSGSIFIENSMLGPPDPYRSQTTGVGAFSGGVLDVRYSTVVDHHWGVGCSVGASSGRIANSIIASDLNGYSIADDYTDCSEAFTLVTNAVDQTGYGTKIAAYSANWFVGASTGNLHLSNAGKVAIPAIAVRGSGDPLVDVDGETRPASAGYPGADEP